MRRFLLHVLPRGLTRIRHYVILSGRVKKKNSEIIRKIKNVVTELTYSLEEAAKKLFQRILGADPDQCPACERGKLEVQGYYKNLLNSA